MDINIHSNLVVRYSTRPGDGMVHTTGCINRDLKLDSCQSMCCHKPICIASGPVLLVES